MADFTISDVLAWARTKPADEKYRYTSPCRCALSQFLIETGRASKPLVGPQDWFESGSSRVRYSIDERLDDAASGGEGVPDEQTFGSFVTRLEALCPDTPVTAANWLSIDAYLTDIEQVSA